MTWRALSTTLFAASPRAASHCSPALSNDSTADPHSLHTLSLGTTGVTPIPGSGRGCALHVVSSAHLSGVYVTRAGGQGKTS